VGVAADSGAVVTQRNLNGLAGTPLPLGTGPLQLYGYDGNAARLDPQTDVDTLLVFDTTDTTDNTAARGTTGRLTRTTLTGLRMGARLLYGTMERLDVRLGQGDDELLVASTPQTAFTVVQGGGGDDTITVSTSQSSGPLVVFGDTSASGTHRVDVAGNDQILAAGSSRDLVL